MLENSEVKDISTLESILSQESSIKNFKYFIRNIYTNPLDPSLGTKNATDQDLLDKKVGVFFLGGDYDSGGDFIWIGCYPGLIYQHWPYVDQKFLTSSRNAHLFINQKLIENPDFEYVRKAMKDRFFDR